MNSNVNQILAEVHKVIVGKDDVMEKILMTLISRGHVLLDDVPGTGKTTAALAFHRALGLRYGRIQFTPDVLPSDIVGFSIYRKESGTFVYQPGAVMTNLLLADEINRTSSKTQAALLEVMEERQVTVRLEMGYPDFESQVNILRDRQQDDPLTQVREVSSAEALLEMQRQAQSVHMADPLLEYVTRLTEATRAHPLVLLGVSPRGALAVCRMAKSRAFMHGRDYVLPEDVQSVFIDVCAHRLFLAPKAKISDTTAADVLTGLLEQVRRPDHI